MPRTVPGSISDHEALTGLCGSLIAITTLALALRLWVRRLQKTRLCVDDWLISLAWLAFIGMNVCVLVGINLKLIGYSVAEGTAAGASPYTNVVVVLTLNSFTTICLGFVKLSALLFYKRVFCSGDKTSVFKILLNVLLAIVSVWIVVFFILQFVQCGPHLDSLATGKNFKSYCHANTPILLSTSVTDLILDVFVVILPIPRIWGLQTTVRRRLAISFVFLTAFVSVGASAARLENVSVQLKRDYADTALSNSSLDFFQIFEAGMGFIAVNLPTLWYLHTKAAPEEILRSIRSIRSRLSLRSGSSGSSLQNDIRSRSISEKPTAINEKSSASSLHSQRYMDSTWNNPPAELSTRTAEITSVPQRALSRSPGNDGGSQKGIQVTKSVGQTVETV